MVHGSERCLRLRWCEVGGAVGVAVAFVFGDLGIRANRRESEGQRHRLQIYATLGQSQVEVLDGFVDFGGVFVPDGDAVDSGIAEGETHGGFTVFAIERAFSGEFHADDAHTVLANLLDVGNDLGNIAGTAGVVVLRVHAFPFVIHANHGDLKKLVVGHLTQRRQTMNRSATAQDNLFGLRFENAVLPASGVGRPGGSVLPVQKHDVEIVRVGELTQLVEFFSGIYAIVERGDLGHDAVGISRNAFQGDAQHAVHFPVGLGGFKEADAAVVGIANEISKSILTEIPLNLAAERTGAKREASDFPVGLAESDPVG